jgi:hypothetical protein
MNYYLHVKKGHSHVIELLKELSCVTIAKVNEVDSLEELELMRAGEEQIRLIKEGGEGVNPSVKRIYDLMHLDDE